MVSLPVSVCTWRVCTLGPRVDGVKDTRRRVAYSSTVGHIHRKEQAELGRPRSHASSPRRGGWGDRLPGSLLKSPPDI